MGDCNATAAMYSDPGCNSTVMVNSTTSTTSLPAEPAASHTTAEIVFIALFAFVLMVVTVTGNLLVIIAYRKNRALRSVNNLFLVSLAFSDLVIGIVSMTLYPVVIINKTWPFGVLACDVWLCIDYTLSMASVANLMLICFDRYLSVTRPFTYRRRRTRAKAKIAIGTAWMFSLLMWSPAILIWPRVRERTVPHDACYIQFFEDPIITSVTAIIAFYLPVIVMVILYWRIFMETRKCDQYLEYLRSYNSNNIGRSPSRRRKSSAPSLYHMRNLSNHFLPPLRRINSSPAAESRYSGRRSISGDVNRKNFLPRSKTSLGDVTENPSEESSSDSGSNECFAPAKMGATPVVDNNNCQKQKTSPELSRFQLLKQTIADSLCYMRKPPDKNEQNDSQEITREKNMRTNREDSLPIRSPSLSSHATLRRISTSLTQSGDNCVLLPNGVNRNQSENISTSEQSDLTSADTANVKKKVSILPVIVTTEEDGEDDGAEHRAPLLTHRSASDGDQARASLSVPKGRETPVIEHSSSRTVNLKVPSSERKAARTLSAILFAFIITWLPYNVCVVYSSFCKVNGCESDVPQTVWDFAYYLCYINSTVNPFCFASCNKTFRDTFYRLLSCSGRSPRRESRWCCRRRSREHNHDTVTTVMPSTSSSRSIPPSPCPLGRRTSST